MATYTKQYLSGSTTGKGIKVTPTASPGETIHTADPTAKDEIYLWAVNTDTVDRKLTIEWGGTAVDDQIEVTIPYESGVLLVVPGLLLGNSLVVKAFADSADKINVFGYVNRIS